jgi:hypothetical protein
MAETSCRRSWIARRALLAVAGVVLLPGLYLGSVASLAYAVHAELLPAWVKTSPVTSAYVMPVSWYMNGTDLPGSDLCEAAMLWCCRAGDRARN